MTNIVRHAQASQASIMLNIEQSTRTLQLDIIDNGQGAALDKIKSGFGLLGMRERINSLGGSLSIATQPQQGLRVRASVPL